MKVFRFFLIMAVMMLQPLSMSAQRLQQPLGRGVVAVKRNGTSRTGDGGSGALISWRKLAQEPEGTTYNVYRRAAGSADYIKMNSTPLKKTNYTPSSLTANTEYAVSAIVNGVEGEISVPFLYKTRAWDNVWFDFDFDNTVIKRDDYRTKFVWPMDLNGNGEVDAIVVDRLFAGAASGDETDSEENTATTSHKIQAYKLDGTLLWTVDMGPNVNICAGQNDMVVAYDINCDGRCEVMIRASDGTRFWDKENETWGKYAMGSSEADTDGDGIVDYRSQTKRNRPFYVSVIDGATGAEIACSELDYSKVTDGSDHYSRDNRSDYMSDGYAAMDGHFSICYLDGVHPSLVMECLDRDNNKTHHNYVFTWDYDWSGGKATNWHQSATWSRNDKRPWPAEFHMLRVADVDGDGCDEMLQGGYALNPLTGFFQSPGIGHGDRYIVSDIDPDRPGMEVFAIQQSALLGQLIYDPATGERIKEWYLPSVFDVGRGSCMDIDPNHRGYEIYSFTDDYIYDCKGDGTGETRSQWGITTCFEGFWWNGDLLREELSSPGGSGWGTNLNVTTVRGKARLIEFSRESSWSTMAATGTRPAFMGDIVGDWREEVILVKQSTDHSTGLTGYSTNLASGYSIYCLQQDPHYRGDCTTRGYYQHPNTSFYLGAGMPMPPLPPCLVTDLRYKSGVIGTGSSSFTTYDLTATVEYSDGKTIMFDITGDNSNPVTISSDIKPAATYFMNPAGHDYFLKGNIAGNGDVIKSQQGTVVIGDNLLTSGRVIISEGTLDVVGSIAGPVELRAKGTLAGSVTLNDTITFEGALNYEGCRLKLGNPMTSKKSMTLPGNVYLEIVDRGHSYLDVEGDLTFKGTNYITVGFEDKTPGECLLAQCSGTLTADISKLKVKGLEGVNYDLVVRDNKYLVLVINITRAAQTDVTWTGAESAIWDYKARNFYVNNESTSFVSGDAIIFPEEAGQRTVNITDKMVTSGVRFTHDSGTYTFQGDGGFSGEADLVMDGAGALVLNATKSDYTGKTILNSGTVTVKNLENKGTESCFGTGSTIEIGKATLIVNHTNAATDRSVVLTDSAAISVPANSTTTLQSALTGKGVLLKRGEGQLNLNYGGSNAYAGTVLEGGTLSQGAWNATLGKSGSKIDVTGNATIRIFNNNSTSAVPSLSNAITVNAGKTLTIGAGQRCKVQGSLAGEGTVKISFPYVRGDFETNLTNFEGTLNPTSGQFRLTSGMNMQKGTFNLGAGVYAVGVQSQSGTETSLTHKIGALTSTASDAQLGTGTWNVGYLGTNTTYAGIIGSNATLNKYGTGTISLTGQSSGKVNIYAGTVSLENSTSTTTAIVTVATGGTVIGTGTTTSITVNKGGTVGAGKATGTTVGTLTITGNLIVQNGGHIRVRGRSTRSVDAFKVAGKVTLNNPVFIMERLSGEWTSDTDYKVFTGDAAITVTGTPTFEPAIPMEGYLWDYSQLASDGIIRIVADPTGISDVGSDANGQWTDAIYDLSGRRKGNPQLPKGIYIVNGKKVLTK
ncbi:MAG: cellulosome protein [Bacteroidaceae bacterium]|nr:cellulosome protein [Bacteroidaceae bacterium]